ncbi:hypothetical protein [Pontibacter mangrovi]|uniref:Uncharacterized protein n=1 Tax=Pontibacter mangrovi TaxID=2589816 RepID=A0A501W312_9BACT|nr:hypothetical protein [Pontibacter mangrovi]TPE43999.1 hypothetical protein FJM65_11280 [Pontibacter mangrovi]
MRRKFLILPLHLYFSRMFLVRLRHWQAFLLLFVLPLLLQQGLLWLLGALGISAGRVLTMLLDALPATVITLWLWTVGARLYKRLPESIKITPLYFYLGCLYMLLYALLFVYTWAVIRDSLAAGTLPLGMLALLVPMHLFATFCYLYAAYFAGRSLVSVETPRVAQSGEYLGTVFLFMLLPLGIWFLQPRLRRIYLSER